MYIHKIKLTNIRGFKSLDFDLQRPDKTYAGWTVFTGDNGSGKSTLLKSIAIGLTGRETARSLQPSFNKWVRYDAPESKGHVELDIVRVKTDDALNGGGKSPGERFPAHLVFENGGKETSLKVELPEGRPKSYQTPERTIWAGGSSGWFCCGYGPFRRVFGESPIAQRLMSAPSTERFVTMFEEAASLAEVDRWLRELDHKKLEMKAAEVSQLAILLSLLRQDLLPNQITVDRVDSDGLWLKDRNGVEISWASMSDGYRSALALVADILRHLINAYGHENLLTTTLDGNIEVARSGVVLIDEIDAHLHPEWQREIGFWLKRHFPKIQFIVTTHSPIICQAADPGGLFVLPEPGSGQEPRRLTDEELNTIIASRPDTILRSPAFGLQSTLSPVAVEARIEYARIEGKKRSTGKLSAEEQKQFKQLELFVNTDEDL
jgi:predicted ATPase